jgi:hypothetical protein
MLKELCREFGFFEPSRYPYRNIPTKILPIIASDYDTRWLSLCKNEIHPEPYFYWAALAWQIEEILKELKKRRKHKKFWFKKRRNKFLDENIAWIESFKPPFIDDLPKIKNYIMRGGWDRGKEYSNL